MSTTVTYTGPEPTAQVAGQTFTKDVPADVTDKAVLDAIRDRQPAGEFTLKPAPKPAA